MSREVMRLGGLRVVGTMGRQECSVQEAQEAARWCPAQNSNYYPVWTSLLPATVLCTHSC